MNSYIVHVSDATGVDEQSMVMVEDASKLGQAVHDALDEVVARHGEGLMFPIFVDVHPSGGFKGNAWMYEGKKTGSSTVLPTTRR